MLVRYSAATARRPMADRGNWALRVVAIVLGLAAFAWGAEVIRQALQADDGGPPLGAICMAVPAFGLLIGAGAVWSSTKRRDSRQGFDVVQRNNGDTVATSDPRHRPRPPNVDPLPNPMALHPSEEATLRRFVVAANRDRLLALFGSPKHRKRALDALNHFAGWDERFAEPVDASADALAVLRKAGAPSQCHVMSGAAELDGLDMSLEEAVGACEGYLFASVMCCLPGKLAFFFDEVAAPRNRLLLRRPGP